jgi:hypothetical protein
MPARKRARDEMEVDEAAEQPSALQRLRNMWQFANLAQYISLFGDAVKIERDFDIEVRLACARGSSERADHTDNGTWADTHAGAGERVPKALPLGEACADWTCAAKACVVSQRPDVGCEVWGLKGMR